DQPAVLAGGDLAHRPRDMLVERWKEAEPVLAGQRFAALRTFDIDRAGLTAGDRVQLVDLDLEATRDQLVRRAHAGHAGAQNNHPLADRSGHRIPPARCDGECAIWFGPRLRVGCGVSMWCRTSVCAFLN